MLNNYISLVCRPSPRLVISGMRPAILPFLRILNNYLSLACCPPPRQVLLIVVRSMPLHANRLLMLTLFTQDINTKIFLQHR